MRKSLTLTERILAVKNGKIVYRARTISILFYKIDDGELINSFDLKVWSRANLDNDFFSENREGAYFLYVKEEPKEPTAQEKFREKIKPCFSSMFSLDVFTSAMFETFALKPTDKE